jgi:hypothetical protein
LAGLTPKVRELMSTPAREQGLHLIAGSHPVLQEDGSLQNEAMLFRPDGTFVSQPKLHITPSETKWWGISGGNQLLVIQTPKAKVGILICYDVEFPEAARYLAEQGVEILFVPYCTDNRQGYLRVTKCAAARAIENQIYVVTTGVVGNLPDVPAMDIGIPNRDRFDSFHYEQARFCSSIAEWKDRDEVVVLLDPIISGGGLQRLSPEIPLLLNSANWLFFHGVNSFTSYLPLDPINTPDDKGRGRRAAGYTPEEFRAFNEYIGRLSLVLRGARRERTITSKPSASRRPARACPTIKRSNGSRVHSSRVAMPTTRSKDASAAPRSISAANASRTVDGGAVKRPISWRNASSKRTAGETRGRIRPIRASNGAGKASTRPSYNHTTAWVSRWIMGRCPASTGRPRSGRPTRRDRRP